MVLLAMLVMVEAKEVMASWVVEDHIKVNVVHERERGACF